MLERYLLLLKQHLLLPLLKQLISKGLWMLAYLPLPLMDTRTGIGLRCTIIQIAGDLGLLVMTGEELWRIGGTKNPLDTVSLKTAGKIGIGSLGNSLRSR